MFAIEFDRRHVLVGRLIQHVPPMVAPLLHLHFRTRPLVHHGMPHGGAFAQRFVNSVLQPDLLAAAPTAVGRDHDAGFQILDSRFQCFGRKAAENHRMRNAKPRAAQHRNRRFGNHRHVDHGPVAGLHPEFEQRTRKARHQPLQFAIGNGPLVARLAFENNRRFVPATADRMPIDAVIANIQLAADEPFGERRIPVKRLFKALEPVQLLLG